MIIKINNLIIKIKLSEIQIINKSLLKKDEKILKSSFDSENDEKLDTEEVITFNKKKDYELVRALKDALLTSSLFKVDVKTAFHIQLSVRIND